MGVEGSVEPQCPYFARTMEWVRLGWIFACTRNSVSLKVEAVFARYGQRQHTFVGLNTNFDISSKFCLKIYVHKICTTIRNSLSKFLPISITEGGIHSIAN